MKKNYTMRASLIIMSLTIITSCFVGGTLAKYTTSAISENNARVAKFGVTFGTVEDKDPLFKTSYKMDTDSTSLPGSPKFKDSVISSNTEGVVAPGTTGKFPGFKITGTPEVAVKISFDGTLDLGTTNDNDNGNWTDKNGDYYCPISISFVGKDFNGDVDETLNGNAYESATEFQTAVKNLIINHAVCYEPGTDLSTETICPEITWKWEYSSSSDNNEKDTYLGNKSDDNLPKIKLDMTCTVEQID